MRINPFLILALAYGLLIVYFLQSETGQQSNSIHILLNHLLYLPLALLLVMGLRRRLGPLGRVRVQSRPPAGASGMNAAPIAGALIMLSYPDPGRSTTAAVKTALAADPALSALKIGVDTNDGVVRLTGPAPDAQARDRAGVLAAAPKGVRSVDNLLKVEPAGNG